MRLFKKAEIDNTNNIDMKNITRIELYEGKNDWSDPIVPGGTIKLCLGKDKYVVFWNKEGKPFFYDNNNSISDEVPKIFQSIIDERKQYFDAEKKIDPRMTDDLNKLRKNTRNAINSYTEKLLKICKPDETIDSNKIEISPNDQNPRWKWLQKRAPGSIVLEKHPKGSGRIIIWDDTGRTEYTLNVIPESWHELFNSYNSVFSKVSNMKIFDQNNILDPKYEENNYWKDEIPQIRKLAIKYLESVSIKDDDAVKYFKKDSTDSKTQELQKTPSLN